MNSDKMMNNGMGVENFGPAGGGTGRHGFGTFFQDDLRPGRVSGQWLITSFFVLATPLPSSRVAKVTLTGGHNWTIADPAFASSL